MATTGFVGHKTPMLGFAIQSALGTAASVASMVFPLRNGTDLKPKRTKEFYQGNAGNQERAHYYTKSIITEGTIDVPLVPGMLAASDYKTGSPLFNWLFVRDDGEPYQGQYATLFEFLGNDEYWIFPDCKCIGGGFKVESGNTVDLSIKVLGGGVPVPGTGGSPVGSAIFPPYSSGVWKDGKPYTFDQVTAKLSTTSSTPATDEYTKSHTPEWDNMVMGADAASMIVYGRLGPYALPNLGRAQWKGSFSRFFFDDDILDAYMSGTAEGSYALTMQGGGVTGTLTFPRIVFSDGGWPSLPGSEVVMYDGVGFEALGGLGVPGTPCFTWTETA